MSEFIAKLGSDPAKLCPFDGLRNQFKEFGVHGVVMGPVVLQVMVSESENVVDMATINDAEGISLANLNDKSVVAYRERISDILQDGKRFGWIDF